MRGRFCVKPRNAYQVDQLVLPPILDACCGPRMMWFDGKDKRALFIDKRQETHAVDIGTHGTVGRAPIEIEPDIVADFTAMPFPDESFYVVVFDPPHFAKQHGGREKGIMAKQYGFLPVDWQETLRRGFRECFRVTQASWSARVQVGRAVFHAIPGA